MGQKSSLLKVILEIRPPATRVEHYFEQIFQTLFWADVWNITFSHHSHFNWCWKWIVRIFGEIWIVRCLSLVSWKMSNGRLFTLSNIGVDNVFKTTTTRCAMFWASIVHWPYLHRSCAHMSHVQCPMYIANIVLHCKQCPTLQTLSYIADIVLHWSLSVLKNRTTTCDPLLHQQPIPVEGGLIHFLQSRFRIFLKLSGFLPPLNMCEKCSKFHKNALQGLFNT